MRAYAPGTSPFHVKGQSYLGIVGSVGSKYGSLEPLYAELTPELRDFASQVFLPVTWYDALPLTPITQAVARVEGLPHDVSMRARVRGVAERDLGRLYRVVLAVASPEMVVWALQKVALRYFDFGKLEVLTTRRGMSEFVFSEFPEPLFPWFAPMFEGYAPVLLAASGARGIEVKVGAPERQGERHGVPLVASLATLRWR